MLASFGALSRAEYPNWYSGCLILCLFKAIARCRTDWVCQLLYREVFEQAQVALEFQITHVSVNCWACRFNRRCMAGTANFPRAPSRGIGRTGWCPISRTLSRAMRASVSSPFEDDVKKTDSRNCAWLTPDRMGGPVGQPSVDPPLTALTFEEASSICFQSTLGKKESIPHPH